ncbi:hypothetical protein FRC09_006595 [Ceratobasidium sp. 395]|nr:hypothetical protein FRC09_006595 [Ceratobasidium sp. 395]
MLNRRKKCDKRRPACERCVRAGFECLGYDCRNDIGSKEGKAAQEPWKGVKIEFKHIVPWPATGLSGNSSVAVETSFESAPKDCSTFGSSHWNPSASAGRVDRSTGLNTALPSSLNGTCFNKLWPQDQSQSLVRPRFSIPPISATGNPYVEGPPALVDHLIEIMKLLCRSIPPSVAANVSLKENYFVYILGEYETGRIRKFFRSPPPPIRHALVSRMKSSGTTVWLMYLGVRIFQALSETASSEAVRPYVYWMDRFDEQVTKDPSRHPSVDDLGDRLAGLLELVFLKFVAINSAAGYSLLRRSLPTFFRLVAADSSLWSERRGLLVSLPRALSAERYEIRRFVYYDTMLAFILGLAPLVEYDSSEFPIISEFTRPLEWVHGIPIELIVDIVQVNAWRAAHPGVPNMSGWVDLEVRAITWEPRTEEIQGGESYDVVTRLAIQESWRHAVLVYVYMGMHGMLSSDFRVQSSVRQIVRLINLVSSGSLDVHLFVPCVAAGIAAQYEHQRTAVRDKLESFSDTRVWLCRGPDLVAVLDHLWHGVGRDGGTVSWEDYVWSRNVVLPIP